MLWKRVKANETRPFPAVDRFRRSSHKMGVPKSLTS